jgi:putative two-component system response regulator
LVLLAESTPSAKEEAILLGARDFIAKPVDPMEAVLRIRNLLEARFCNQQLQAQNEVLEARVRERTAELEEAQFEVLERLALAAEYRDDSTGQHTRRVGQLSALVARNLGFPGKQVALIRRAAPLHDVGKIGIPDHILLKAGKLTEGEYGQMKAHTFIGARILSESRFPLLEEAQEIALTHHERWDGTGYPHRLKGNAIPVTGRIVAVADVFDALTHQRPYKQAWTVDAAVAEIVSQRNRQFDPAVVDAFLRVLTQENLARMELGAAR